MKLIIASKSETRMRMLEAAGVPFEIAEAAVDEEAAKAELKDLEPMAMAEALAERKAV